MWQMHAHRHALQMLRKRKTPMHRVHRPLHARRIREAFDRNEAIDAGGAQAASPERCRKIPPRTLAKFARAKIGIRRIQLHALQAKRHHGVQR